MHTLEQNYKGFNSISPQNITSATTTNGASVDTKELGDDLMVVLSLGTLTGSHTIDVKLQDSADDSTFADISGATFPQITESADDTVAALKLNLEGLNRFIRVVSVTAGTVTASNISAAVLVKAVRGSAALNSTTPA